MTANVRFYHFLATLISGVIGLTRLAGIFARLVQVCRVARAGALGERTG